MKEKTLKVSLELAREWYNKGENLRELALTLFNENDILYGCNPSIEEILDKFEKNYPINSIVWSSDGTDNLPNIIVSKPRIEKRDVLYDYKYPYNIVFDTYRIYVYDNTIYKSHIVINGGMFVEDFINGIIYSRKGTFNQNKYKKDIIARCQTSIERRLKRIEDAKKEITDCESDIKECQEVLDNFDDKFNSLVQQVLSLSNNDNNI